MVIVCLHSPTPVPIPIPIPIRIIFRKGSLGQIPMVIPMQSCYENYLKNHVIGTDISVKFGIVPICIGIGISIGIGIGPLYSLLKKTIKPNSIGIRVGVCVGIGVGQSEHTLRGRLPLVYIWPYMEIYS